ncbi:MAG: ABC transporter permease [Lentisphaeria bacterium]|nr:ABC transporter permease [Lentisphaeria bacterium]
MSNSKIRTVFSWIRRQWRENPLFSTCIALAVMVIVQTLALGVHFDSFGDWFSSFCTNWINVLRNNATVGIISLGMTFVLVSGGIDLAVGSTLCMTGALFMLLTDSSGHGILAAAGIHGWMAFAIALLLVILACALLGGLNGLLIANGRIPPFIVTLGTMKLFRSLTQFFMQKRTPVFPEPFLNFASLKTGDFMLMPIIYWLVVAVLLHFLFRKTVFGNHVIAIGSNEKAAKLSGINVNAIKRWVYILTGCLVALASTIQISRLGSMDYSNAGSGSEMDAIASVIVGGTRMSGGRGSIVGTMLGVLIIGVMNNLLNLMGVPPFLREAFKGVIVIVAVLLQRKEKTS